MTRIFIVEDENITLRALKQKITDLHENYEIIGTAKNGLEAYGQIVNLKPDILITDIRMPDMDGLSLLEKLKDAHCDIISVVLSGYSDFTYAQKAIQLDVSAYLLKPIEIDALRNCLSECARKAATSAVPQNVSSLVMCPDKIILEGSHPGILYDIVYLIFSNPLTTFESIIHPNISFLKNSEIQALFESSIPAPEFFCLEGFFSNEKAILFRSNSSNEKIETTLRVLLKTLTERFDYPVTACYSTTKSELLSSCLRICRRCAAQQALLGESTLCNISKTPKKNAVDLNTFSQLFPILLHQKESGLLLSNIKKLLTLEHRARRPVLQIQRDLSFLLTFILQSFPESPLTSEECDFYLENIFCFSSSYENLAENYCILLNELFVNTASNLLCKESKENLIAQIEKYMEDNLSQNITLQMLAEYANRSKVYLCRIFKELKNMTPIDYFTHLKMQRAQQILLEYPNIPLQKLSESLGFSDAYYFSKVFKRITHLSPSEFRQKIQ